MTDHGYTGKNVFDNLLEELISQPISGLEKKIKNLEQEVLIRQTIRDQILTTLANQKLRFEQELWLNRYTPLVQPNNNSIQFLKDKLLDIIVAEIRESVSSFRDLFKLNETLIETKSELEQAMIKSSLITSPEREQ